MTTWKQEGLTGYKVDLQTVSQWTRKDSNKSRDSEISPTPEKLKDPEPVVDMKRTKAVCKYWISGTCWRRTNCFYRHPSDNQWFKHQHQSHRYSGNRHQRWPRNQQQHWRDGSENYNYDKYKDEYREDIVEIDYGL